MADSKPFHAWTASMGIVNGYAELQALRSDSCQLYSSQLYGGISFAQMERKPQKMEKRISAAKDGFVCVVLTGLLYWVYSPAFLNSYAFSDDYPFLYDVMVNGSNNYNVLVGAGRPVNYFLIQNSFKWAGDIGSLAYVRMMGGLGLALMAGCFYFFWNSFFNDRKIAACLAVSFSCLSAIQIWMAWTQLWTMPWAILMVVAAFHIYEKVCSSSLAGIWFMLCLLAAIILEMTASLIYQPAVLIVIPLLYAKYVPVNKERFGRRFISHFLIMMVSVALGVILVKCFPVALNPRAQLTQDIIGKLTWFISEPLMNSLTPFVIRGEFSYNLQKAMAILISILSIAGLLINRKDNKHYISPSNVFVLLFFLLCSHAHYLLVSENWASYRSTYALEVMVFVAIVLAINNICMLMNFKPKTVLFLLFLLIAAFAATSAHYNITESMVKPQTKELEYLKTKLSELDIPSLKEIKLVRSQWPDTISPWLCYDEFGIQSSAISWSIEPMARILSRQMGNDPSYDSKFMQVTEHPISSEGTAIIDMGLIRSMKLE